MAATGLLEALFALALHGIVLASLLAGTTTLTVLAREAWSIHAESFAERQVESLVDIATGRAGTGPGSPAALASAAAASVVLQADLNGNGVADTTSAERTELELRTSSGTRVLYYRIGGQAMKVEEKLPATSAFALLAKNGAIAGSTADATCVVVPRPHGTLYTLLAARVP
jgi:hypothetical protein